MPVGCTAVSNRIRADIERTARGAPAVVLARCARKFHVKGITYGPFAPNAQGEAFASPEQTARDLQQISELGAIVLRVYHVPPRWFLDLAAELIQYRFSRKEIEKEDYQKQFLAALNARSTLGVSLADSVPVPSTSPDQGHLPGKFTGARFLEWSFCADPALHR